GEGPDTGAAFQLGAGIVAGRAGDAVLFLTAVGSGADVHVHHVAVERDALGNVPAIGRQALHHRLGIAGRLERPGQAPAHHVIGPGKVEVAVVDLHVVAAAGTEAHRE